MTQPDATDTPDSVDGPDSAETTARLLRHRLASGPLRLPVSGSSMRGTIASGSEVELVAATRPSRGEIWAFAATGDTVVVHRVRELAEGMVICRGSGNPVDDPPLPLSRAVGRVRRAIPPEGSPRSFGRVDRHRAALAFRLRRLARRIRPRAGGPGTGAP